MAQSDANEQVKEILRQLIKHRFWIATGFATLFAVIAYFMGSGPVQAKAKEEITKITNAEKGVKAYQSTAKPTADYKPVVEEKTGIMSKDVNKAWKELYDRQAPLLTWPEIVKDRIGKWGRQWPKDQDAGKVQLAIVDYIEAYPSYVDMVYKTFDPFDYETGKGVVAAPPKEMLLRPAQFSIDGSKLPTLGKVWAAQERLWTQRTMLEVIHQVNKKAKDWDSAIVKEILALEVGNPDAQDQRSLAKGEAPTKAPDVLSPEQEAAAAASSTDAGGGGAGAGPGAGQMGMRMQMMGGAKQGLANKADDEIYFITPADDKGQYKILPVMMTVLVDQDRVQDLLVEMENSPMSIQVKDLELEKPSAQVTRPEKGEARAGATLLGGGMRGMMGKGFGGMAAQFQGQMMNMSRMGGAMGGGMMGGQAAQRAGMMGNMMGGGGAAEKKKGVDIRNVNREADRKKKAEELEKHKGPSLFDPYFNIVQVTVYGQARFFNPPPVEETTPESPGETPAAAPAATPEAEKKAEAPAEKKAEAPAEKKAEAPAEKKQEAPAEKKAEAPAAEKKGEAPAAAPDQKAQAQPDAAKSAEEKPAAKSSADATAGTTAKDAPKAEAPGASPKK